MHINSRFTDFYDWSQSCTFNNKDIEYNRSLKWNKIPDANYNFDKCFQMIILFGNKGFGITIKSDRLSWLRVERDVFKDIDRSIKIDSSSIHNGKLICESKHIDILSDRTLTKSTILSEHEVEIIRSTHNISNPIVCINRFASNGIISLNGESNYKSYNANVFYDFSIATSGLQSLILEHYEIEEIASAIDMFISMQSDVLYNETDDNIKIESNGFDTKSSFRHRK